MSKHSILAVFGMLLLAALALTPVRAEEPGRGLTARFEQRYLEFIIDHHYAALRMTELAAGRNAFRSAGISPLEGTAPTPGTAGTTARSRSADIRSLARRNNRAQREEILKAQSFLKAWYGTEHRPELRPENQAQIALLEQAPAGPAFDHLFLEVFSRHHFTALAPSAGCQAASDVAHTSLHRYCAGIVHAQLNDIADMREMLCKRFQICDYQPVVGLKGRHSGGDGSLYVDQSAGGM